MNLPFQLRDPPVGLGDAFQLLPQCLGVGVGQLIGLPQPVDDLLLLHGPGVDFLFQPGRRAFQVQQVLVHLLALPVLGRPLRL